MNIEEKDLGSDVDPETGDFTVNTEKEYSMERMERLRARIIELLLSDVGSVVASMEATTMEDQEDFVIEIPLDTLESGDTDITLSKSELDELNAILNSPQAQEIYKKNNLKFVAAVYSLDHLHRSELVFSLTLRITPEQKEMSAEFVEMRFSNTCAYCNNEVVVVETVPTSLADEWTKSKKKKDRENGQEYRDWNYGEVECPHCEVYGKPPKVLVWRREYR